MFCYLLDYLPTSGLYNKSYLKGISNKAKLYSGQCLYFNKPNMSVFTLLWFLQQRRCRVKTGPSGCPRGSLLDARLSPPLTIDSSQFNSPDVKGRLIWRRLCCCTVGGRCIYWDITNLPFFRLCVT